MEGERRRAHTPSGSDRRLYRSRRGFLGGLGMASATALSGCLVRGEDSGLRGEIRVDGSNTLLPHAAAIAEEFQWRNNRVQIPVRGSGTGAGFQRFATGETHIQNASREIQPGEEQLCAEHGVEFLELEVVLDGIALWINPGNEDVDCLTIEQVRELWQRESTIERWSDLDPEWPDEEISLYGRDSASGTFDYFTEALTDEVGNIRSDYSGTPDTNVIVDGVRGDRYALGFGGAGYYYENEEDLKLLAIDDGAGCLQPTRETIEDGSYTPLSRPMYIYINVDELDRPAFRRYVEFFFEEIDEDADRDVVDEGETLTWTQWAARRVGFYAIPDETVEESRTTLEEVL